jgi:membrane peptidoglycan carboxypeptidase
MIEFGPQIYGIERAAQTYFGKKATALSPLESAFLAANKPCPKCGHKRFESKKWTPWWQSRMVGIMTKMRDNLIIDDAQFVAEAPYVPRFVGWEHLAPPPDQGPAAEPLGGVEE